MEYIRTPAQAELNAANQMRTLGYDDATAVPGGADGGIDVRSSRAVAQVKWRGAQVTRPELQNLYGARGLDHHKELWFFAASGYTKTAIDYANLVEMALHTYEPSGFLQPINRHATSKILEVEKARAAAAAVAAAAAAAVQAERELQARLLLQRQAEEQAARTLAAQRKLAIENDSSQVALRLRETVERNRRVDAIRVRKSPTSRRAPRPPAASVRQAAPAPLTSFLKSGNSPVERQAMMRKSFEQQLKANGVPVGRRYRSSSRPSLVNPQFNEDVLINVATSRPSARQATFILPLAAVCAWLGWVCFRNASSAPVLVIIGVFLWLATASSLTVGIIVMRRSSRRRSTNDHGG